MINAHAYKLPVITHYPITMISAQAYQLPAVTNPHIKAAYMSIKNIYANIGACDYNHIRVGSYGLFHARQQFYNTHLHGSTCRASAGHPGNLSPPSSHDERVHLVDAILEDHKDIQAFFELYKTSDNSKDKIKWSNQWRWEVARHAIGEELVAYPVIESNVIGGVALANKDRSQHLLVKKHLSQLDGMSIDDPTFDLLMQQTQDALLQHIQQEEENELPLLRNSISNEEGLRLGSRFELTKSLAPTRSHPVAPQNPPFETIASLLAAPLDKLRDMFDQFPSEEEINQAKGQKHNQEWTYE